MEISNIPTNKRIVQGNDITGIILYSDDNDEIEVNLPWKDKDISEFKNAYQTTIEENKFISIEVEKI